MQFSTKFILFFVLYVWCLTVQAQPPNNGEPTFASASYAKSSASPWTNTPQINFGFGFQKRKTATSLFSKSISLEYKTINLANVKKQTFGAISVPVLMRYNITKADATFISEIFGGIEPNAILSAKSYIAQPTEKDKNQNVWKIPVSEGFLMPVNIALTVGIEAGLNRVRFGTRFSVNTLANDKHPDKLKTAELYLRFRFSKAK